VVDHPLKALTVLAKPADIPSSIELNIEDLDIGVTVTVAELDLPAGVTTEADPESPVVTGMATRFSVQLDHGVAPGDLDDGEGGGEPAEGDSAEAAEADAE
jgi:large subunit ribosomal protein L25